MLKSIPAIFIMTLFFTNLSIARTEVTMLQRNTHSNAVSFTELIPSGFHLVLQENVQHNKIKSKLFRFERDSDKIHYNSENTSLLISEAGRLEGLSRLLPMYEFRNNNIDQDEARNIAEIFLQRYAPDLLLNYTVQWIDRHDEFIYENGRKITISGVKVKCRNINDGLYFWVIVSPAKDVLVFERDIEWDFIRAGRQTEKWLHDDWLQTHQKL